MGRNRKVGIATTLWAERFGDCIPVGAKFSSPVQTGLPTLLHIGGNAVKRLWYDVNHSIPPNDEVKERIELHFYTPLGLYGWLQDELYFLPFPITLEQDTHEKEKRTACSNYCVSGLLPSSLTARRKKGWE